MDTEKLIALSFDDGPNLTTTLQVLDVLEKNDVKASFFLIGNKITDETKKVMMKELEQGHEICCHSTAHRVMSEMTFDEIKEDISACTAKIAAVTGKEPAFFRPPYIAVNETLLKAVSMTFISGIGCEDWVPAVSASERARRIMENAEDGQIVLLHDFEGNDNTVEALKTVIPELKKRGYRFVMVSELFRLKKIVPAGMTVYSNVLQNTRVCF